MPRPPVGRSHPERTGYALASPATWLIIALMTYTDLKGLAVSTTSSDALSAYERGIDLFLRWRAGALDAFDAAIASDSRFVLAHCTKAYIASRMGRADITTSAAG